MAALIVPVPPGVRDALPVGVGVGKSVACVALAVSVVAGVGVSIGEEEQPLRATIAKRMSS